VSDAPFAVTFLGHQGWFVRGDDTAILIDPLLCEPFGAAHALDYRVWPPRAWTVGELPPIDAVVLSHEHDDHFDIPSLAKLDRRVAIYLSSRSSPAARGILAAMGFTDVRPLAPGARVAIGALDVLPFTGDHVNVNCGEEWDTLPMIVRHRGGAGSLFTMVDITITPQHVEWARAAVSRPGLVTWTNNSMDWSHMTDWLPVRADATHQAFMKMGTGHKLIASTWGTPAAMLTCAGGFSFAGGDDRAWLNAHAFCVDMEQVCKAMLGVYRKERFVAARPGNTFAMKANRLERVDDRAPFLASVPAAEWPSRAKQAGDPRAGDVPDYAPATGRRELTDAERGELAERVGAVAGELVGGAVFRGLCSLLATEHPRPTFAFVARDGDARREYAYDLVDCRFVGGPFDAGARTLAGLECWGSDLLAVLRGELGPIALSFGRARLWNALPARFRFKIFDELHRISHPMRRADAYAATYARLYAPHASEAPVIRARVP
jgi:L-ascorbate metabolism protein UlaG (beta-lactamase superfamily)